MSTDNERLLNRPSVSRDGSGGPRVDYQEELERLRKTLPPIILDDIHAFTEFPTRRREFVLRKTKLIMVLRDWYKLSFIMIGLLLNNDHSSVMHLYRKGHARQNTKEADREGSEGIV